MAYRCRAWWHPGTFPLLLTVHRFGERRWIAILLAICPSSHSRRTLLPNQSFPNLTLMWKLSAEFAVPPSIRFLSSYCFRAFLGPVWAVRIFRVVCRVWLASQATRGCFVVKLKRHHMLGACICPVLPNKALRGMTVSQFAYLRGCTLHPEVR